MSVVLTAGELMMRLSPPSFERFSQAGNFEVHFGGSEANVAVSLSQMGMDTVYLTRLPDSDLGRSALCAIQKRGVNISYISLGGERLGLYFLEKGTSVRPGKVIYDRAHSAFSEINIKDFKIDEALKGVSWLHWSGVTPAISKSSAEFCFELVNIARRKKITISADINFRKGLWKYGIKPAEVMPSLLEKSDIVIGGKDDTENVLGIPGVNLRDPEKVAKAWMKKLPSCKAVILTERDSINASHNIYQAKLWDGKKMFDSYLANITNIVDRVGTGDAFTAGIIFGFHHFKNNYKKILDFAVAAAALKHTVPGDFNICSIDEIEKLMKGDSSGKVNR